MNTQELETLIQKMPIGTPVRYFPVISDRSKIYDTVTRSEPWLSESGHVVVMIKGKSGFVAVSNIRLLPKEANPSPVAAEEGQVVTE